MARRDVVRDGDVLDERALPRGPESLNADGPTELDPSLSLPLLTTLIDVVDAAVFVLDRQGRMVVMNEQGRALLETHGNALGAVLHPAASASDASTTREATVAALGELRIWRRDVPTTKQGPHALVLVEQEAPADMTQGGVLDNAARIWGLTARQKDVFRLVLEGWSNKEIASRLRMACRTVEVHISAVFDKAGVESRARLIATAWTLGRLGRLRT